MPAFNFIALFVNSDGFEFSAHLLSIYICRMVKTLLDALFLTELQIKTLHLKSPSGKQNNVMCLYWVTMIILWCNSTGIKRISFTHSRGAGGFLVKEWQIMSGGSLTIFAYFKKIHCVAVDLLPVPSGVLRT